MKTQYKKLCLWSSLGITTILASMFINYYQGNLNIERTIKPKIAEQKSIILNRTINLMKKQQEDRNELEKIFSDIDGICNRLGLFNPDLFSFSWDFDYGGRRYYDFTNKAGEIITDLDHELKGILNRKLRNKNLYRDLKICFYGSDSDFNRLLIHLDAINYSLIDKNLRLSLTRTKDIFTINSPTDYDYYFWPVNEEGRKIFKIYNKKNLLVSDSVFLDGSLDATIENTISRCTERVFTANIGLENVSQNYAQYLLDRINRNIYAESGISIKVLRFYNTSLEKPINLRMKIKEMKSFVREESDLYFIFRNKYETYNDKIYIGQGGASVHGAWISTANNDEESFIIAFHEVLHSFKIPHDDEKNSIMYGDIGYYLDEHYKRILTQKTKNFLLKNKWELHYNN